MGTNLLDEYFDNTESRYSDLDGQITEIVINDLKKTEQYHKCDDSPLDTLLYNCFYLRKIGKYQVLEEILNKYNINYYYSIHNAIYNLLGIEKDKSLYWPGVIAEKDDGILYELKTVLGTIKIYKASKIFSGTKSSYIFKKSLITCCYERSFDFLKENRDYKAVLSYNSNLFVGGHFHAYLEKDEITLDISSNALYTSKEDKDKVLKGEILAKLTYDEVVAAFNELLEKAPDLDKDDNKLQVLSLYYGMKKGIK